MQAGEMQGRPVAVLLAGGLARRMGGGDKPLRTLAGRPLLDYVLDRVRPQVRAMALKDRHTFKAEMDEAARLAMFPHLGTNVI